MFPKLTCQFDCKKYVRTKLHLGVRKEVIIHLRKRLLLVERDNLISCWVRCRKIRYTKLSDGINIGPSLQGRW